MNELVLADKAAEWRRLKALVLDSVSSPITRRVYNLGLDEFFAWYGQEVRPGFTKATVAAWRVALEARGLGSISINVRITAVRKLAVEAADNGLLLPEIAAGITRIKGVASKGVRLGNWLSVKQAQSLLHAPDATTKKGLRDRAILAVLLGCGLRRSEVTALAMGHVQQRDGRWCIVDLVGKHGRVRTVPMPTWVKVAIDAWTREAGIVDGQVFRPVHRGDQVRGEPPRVKKHLAITLAPQQQSMLLESASGPWCIRAYLELDAATGCRRGELLVLRWSDIVGNCAIIARSLTQTRDRLEFKDTKTEKPRSVYLPESAIETLKVHRCQQDEFRRKFGPDYRANLDLVFADPDGTPLKPDSISATVSALFKRLKIAKPKGAALHLLRHTHTSVLLAQGVSLPTVSARLGHSSVRTTQEIYAHMITGQDEEAARKWEEYQRRNCPPKTEDWKGDVQ